MNEKKTRNLEILQMRKNRYKLIQISKKYGISTTRVYDILKNATKIEKRK